MRHRALQLVTALLPLVLGIPQAFAQGHGAVEVKIPFAFTVGDRILEPGDYIVDVVGTIGPGVLAFRATDGGEQVMVDTDQLPDKDKPGAISLVFDKVGDHYRLEEIWGVENSGRGVKRIVAG